MQKNEKPMDIAEVLARRKPQLIAKRAMDILLSACALECRSSGLFDRIAFDLMMNWLFCVDKRA